MDDLRVPLIDSAFSTWSRSASLREENKDVHPTYFKWATGPDYPAGLPYFYTDNAILSRKTFARNAVAWLLEPRCLRPENYEAAKEKAHHFKAVLSYDVDFLKEVPNGRWYPVGGSSISFDKWGIYPKTKNACMFVSDKRTTEGHHLRHAIAEKFGDRIDIFGKGVGRPVDRKFDVLKDYRYCVVVESCNIDGYFSEKVIDPISVGTFPLYIGGRHEILDSLKDMIVFMDSFDFETICRRINYFVTGITPFGKIISLDQDGYVQDWQKIYKTIKSLTICEDIIYENYGDLFQHEQSTL